MVAAIGQLDPDRAGIHVHDIAPSPRTGVPGPHLLVDQLPDTAGLADQVMR